MNSAERLCLACGLCCDGTLFDNVQLGPDDHPARLKSLGLPVTVSRASPPITRFAQPCAALCADRTCRLYADRPLQCRDYECGVYRDALAGRIDYPTALRLVRKARRQADQIRELLRQLGDTDESRSLNERFRRTQRRMESGNPDVTAVDTFAELSQAMHAFGLMAHAKLYTRG